MPQDNIALPQLCHAARGLVARWLAVLAPLAGLELPTASILLTLLEEAGEELDTDLQALAKLAGLSPSNARRLTLHLANLAWIDMEVLPSDRLRLSLTDAGRRLALQLL